MSFEGMGISLTLIILVVLWVAAPLLSGRHHKAVVSHDLSLAATYERVLVAIRDLDEDYATGKIDAAAYGREREKWLERGIAVLRSLDAVGQLGDATNSVIATEETVEDVDQVEQALAAYRRSTRSARSTAH
ncbi:MAG: hypothetical protein KF726_25480 [Anaerolineae bacterium]|nr:hypothetical protein [Anaerolineae bacterium]